MHISPERGLGNTYYNFRVAMPVRIHAFANVQPGISADAPITYKLQIPVLLLDLTPWSFLSSDTSPYVSPRHYRTCATILSSGKERTQKTEKKEYNRSA